MFIVLSLAIIEFLLSNSDKGFSLSRDKGKDVIAKMRPKVLKLCDGYERSGAGGGQRSLEDDEDFGCFDIENLIDGNDMRNFLGSNGSDVLYWWRVLFDEELLHFTLAVLPEETQKYLQPSNGFELQSWYLGFVHPLYHHHYFHQGLCLRKLMVRELLK